jgi:hypothetical protein
MISLGGLDNLDSESQAGFRDDGEECIIWRKHDLIRRQKNI